jgi:phosphoglycolate phosphatase
MAVTPSPPGALLLDFDGTLVDSAPDLAAALNRVLSEAGRSNLGLGDIKAMVGDGVAKLVERGLAATGPIPHEADLRAVVARFLELYGAAASLETRPYPGVVETLGSLKAAGWRLAVCTNKAARLTVQILADLNMAGLFEAVVGGDSLPVRKPDGGHLLGTLARLAEPAASAVMVGDSRNDLLSARDAGLPIVLVTYGYEAAPRSLGADRVIDRFAELPAALADLALG